VRGGRSRQIVVAASYIQNLEEGGRYRPFKGMDESSIKKKKEHGIPGKKKGALNSVTLKNYEKGLLAWENPPKPSTSIKAGLQKGKGAPRRD